MSAATPTLAVEAPAAEVVEDDSAPLNAAPDRTGPSGRFYRTCEKHSFC